jgi:hypothetical protein
MQLFGVPLYLPNTNILWYGKMILMFRMCSIEMHALSVKNLSVMHSKIK